MKSILILLTVGLITLASAQTMDEKNVASAVEKLRKAMVDGDKTALESVTTVDLSYGHSSGTIEDKAAFVDAIASGKNNFSRIDLSDQTIKTIDKNLAIVRHKFNADVLINGNPSSANIGILQVWQKQNGQWKLLARQAFKLP